MGCLESLLELSLTNSHPRKQRHVWDLPACWWRDGELLRSPCLQHGGAGCLQGSSPGCMAQEEAQHITEMTAGQTRSPLNL